MNSPSMAGPPTPPKVPPKPTQDRPRASSVTDIDSHHHSHSNKPLPEIINQREGWRKGRQNSFPTNPQNAVASGSGSGAVEYPHWSDRMTPSLSSESAKSASTSSENVAVASARPKLGIMINSNGNGSGTRVTSPLVPSSAMSPTGNRSKTPISPNRQSPNIPPYSSYSASSIGPPSYSTGHMLGNNAAASASTLKLLPTSATSAYDVKLMSSSFAESPPRLPNEPSRLHPHPAPDPTLLRDTVHPHPSHPTSALSTLYVQILPLFNGSPLRSPIEDLNVLVRSHIHSTMSRAAPSKTIALLTNDLKEILMNGMLTLVSKFDSVEDEYIVDRLVEVWSFFFTNIIPYIEGVFLPLGTDATLLDLANRHVGPTPSSQELGSYATQVSRAIDVRKSLLTCFMVSVVELLSPRLIPLLVPPAPPPSEAHLAKLLQMCLILSSQADQTEAQEYVSVLLSVVRTKDEPMSRRKREMKGRGWMAPRHKTNLPPRPLRSEGSASSDEEDGFRISSSLRNPSQEYSQQRQQHQRPPSFPKNSSHDTSPATFLSEATPTQTFDAGSSYPVFMSPKSHESNTPRIRANYLPHGVFAQRNSLPHQRSINSDPAENHYATEDDDLHALRSPKI